MYIVFYRTGDVFEAEEVLNSKGYETKIVPTPVQDKAYCGVCIKIITSSVENLSELLSEIDHYIIEN